MMTTRAASRDDRLGCLGSQGAPRRRHGSVGESGGPRPRPGRRRRGEPRRTVGRCFAGQSVLFFGSYWPDPCASGAGVRTFSLLKAFLGDWKYARATYATPQKENECSERLTSTLEVRARRCQLNRRDDLARLIATEARPDVVVFDRYTSEEAYSAAVHESVSYFARWVELKETK